MKTECGPVTPPTVLGPANKPPYTQTAARVAAVLAKSAAATQPPQHHQRPQFFGHNPNLKCKLPSNLNLRTLINHNFLKVNIHYPPTKICI